MLVRGGLLCSFAKIHLVSYEQYQTDKATRKPFGKVKWSSFVLELDHYNICEKMNVIERYF